MPKWFRLFYFLHHRNSIVLVFFLGLTINFFYYYGLYNYPHIPRDGIEAVLYKKVIHDVLWSDKPNCTYENILQSTESIHSWEVHESKNDFDSVGIVNGSFVPTHCNPLFSVAILVTFRNRHEHVDTFLPYMHNFLRRQNIHYKIYMIEQKDKKPWNKGLLYNLGARQAIADNFPCLILHDLDLLPLDESNLYACSNEPRHLSASVDKYRFVLLYTWLIGGVLAIRSDQYEKVDGFSNRFLNWGGEDDDFYMRLGENNITVIRFPPSMSRYTMLHHRRNPAVNPARFAQAAANRRDTPAARALDGMRALHTPAPVKNHRLTAIITVDTDYTALKSAWDL